MTAMKKIELHLHIEGAAPPALIRSLAAEKKQDLSGIFDAQGAYSYSGFNDFLRVYEAATSVLTTPRDYARLLTEVLAEAAAHGAVYAELFVSPEFCGGADLSAWRDYLAAMEEAAQAAEREGIASRAILTPIRHFGAERARRTAICAAETSGGWVTGFGIGHDRGEIVDPAFVAGVLAACKSTDSNKSDYQYKDVPFTNVHFSDNFWASRIETIRSVTVPFAFHKCEENDF